MCLCLVSSMQVGLSFFSTQSSYALKYKKVGEIVMKASQIYDVYIMFVSIVIISVGYSEALKYMMPKRTIILGLN